MNFKKFFLLENAKIVVNDKSFVNKTDPTQYSKEKGIILVKSNYDVKRDPEGWMVHEQEHHRVRNINDDGKEYPYNNTERSAYIAQFKELYKRGFSLEDVKDPKKFPTLSIKFLAYDGEWNSILTKYWNIANPRKI